MFLGVDGCKGGWIAASWDASPSPPRLSLHTSFADLWHAHAGAACILVDIPIGLSDAPRACDVAARAMLGRRGVSVFPAPCRAAVDAPDYPEANRRSRAACGRGLTKQTWMIVPKIREVDRLLRTDARARAIVRECHPEVCFAAIAGEGLREGKRTDPGFARRLALLERLLPGVHVCIEAALARRLAARDDIVDALVAAWCAAAGARDIRTLPADPPRDSAGLPMEMVYRVPPGVPNAEPAR